jgi:hypothetical protein
MIAPTERRIPQTIAASTHRVRSSISAANCVPPRRDRPAAQEVVGPELQATLSWTLKSIVPCRSMSRRPAWAHRSA